MRRLIGTLTAAAALSLVLAGSALAAPGPKWDPFGSAAWRPHTGNASQHGLLTTSNATTGDFGGIELVRGFETNSADVGPISFDFLPDASGNSLGSPRLVVLFSDGGNGQLRPLTWIQDTWTTVDGRTGNNWDNAGGACGFQFATTWEAIVACHPGASITGVFVVNDNGPTPDTHQVVLDNIVFDDAVSQGPGNST